MLDYVILIMLGIVFISIFYFSRKYYSLHKKVLEHIKLNFPKEYKELRIIAPGGRYGGPSLLTIRIKKHSKYLPHDIFLDEKYKELIKLQKILMFLFIIFTLVCLISFTVKFSYEFLSI